MNGDSYTDKLCVFNQLSAGLKAYISTIEEKTYYRKGDSKILARDQTIFFPFVKTGKLKVVAIDRENNYSAYIATYGADDFLYHIVNLSLLSNYDLHVEFLENSSLIGISEKHFFNVMKLFSDAYLLNLSYTSFHFNMLFKLLAQSGKTD